MKSDQSNGIGRLLRLLAIVTLAFCGGCASQGEKMVDSFSRTRDSVTESRRQVDNTLVALHAMRSMPGPELKEGFQKYRDAVITLEERGNSAKRRAESMQAEADAHIKAWEQEMETLKDPAVQATMQDRRRAVRSNFELVKMYAQDARKAYGPYLAGNQEIVRALSIDLSPAAISSLSASIDRVLLDGKALQERLGAMQQALNNISAGVSPLGKMK